MSHSDRQAYLERWFLEKYNEYYLLLDSSNEPVFYFEQYPSEEDIYAKMALHWRQS